MGRESGRAGRAVRLLCKSDPSEGEWEGRLGRIFLDAVQCEKARQGCQGALEQTLTVRGVSCLPGTGLP